MAPATYVRDFEALTELRSRLYELYIHLVESENGAKLLTAGQAGHRDAANAINTHRDRGREGYERLTDALSGSISMIKNALEAYHATESGLSDDMGQSNDGAGR